MSFSMARHAAALISGGAGKSGIPWAKLTAPYRWASIDMPRITLSVNRAALWESRGSCIWRADEDDDPNRFYDLIMVRPSPGEVKGDSDRTTTVIVAGCGWVAGRRSVRCRIPE